MSLGKKMLTIVVATVSGAALIAYILSCRILLSSFYNLQEEETRINLRRTLGAMSNDINKLSTITGDWGRWNDTYQFVVDHNQSYIKNNMITITFTELRLDHIVYLDSSGRIVHAAGYDLSSKKRIPASAPTHQKLAVNPSDIPISTFVLPCADIRMH